VQAVPQGLPHKLTPGYPAKVTTVAPLEVEQAQTMAPAGVEVQVQWVALGHQAALGLLETVAPDYLHQ